MREGTLEVRRVDWAVMLSRRRVGGRAQWPAGRTGGGAGGQPELRGGQAGNRADGFAGSRKDARVSGRQRGQKQRSSVLQRCIQPLPFALAPGAHVRGEREGHRSDLDSARDGNGRQRCGDSGGGGVHHRFCSKLGGQLLNFLPDRYKIAADEFTPRRIGRQRNLAQGMHDNSNRSSPALEHDVTQTHHARVP